jgi:outer membrane protein TolC
MFDVSFAKLRACACLGPVWLAALPAVGCVSAQTSQRLDRSYDQASQQLRKPLTAKQTPTIDPTAPLDRETVVKMAVAKSPSLAAMAHRARALVHAGRAEGSLPPPELGAEAWNLPLARPYAVGEADMYMVELSQRFPPAGSRDGRARAMAEEAQIVLAEVATEERLVAEQAANAFVEYAQAFEEQRLHQRHLALLDRMSQAIRARYASGGSGLADVARLEIEVSKVHRGVARIEGDIVRARSALNVLLRRPISAPLGEPRQVSPETIRLPIDDLLSRATSNRGSTLAADARVAAAAARRDAAESEANVPEFMVGLGYWQAPEMRAGVGATASMSLPWLWGPGRQRVYQAQEEEAAERSERDGTGLESQSEVSEAYARLVAFEQQLVTIRKQALPAARRSIDAVTAAFSTGKVSLLEWVDAQRSVLELEMEVLDLQGEIAHGVNALERAVGAPLPRVALALEQAP